MVLEESSASAALASIASIFEVRAGGEAVARPLSERGEGRWEGHGESGQRKHEADGLNLCGLTPAPERQIVAPNQTAGESGGTF
jgi:hypothetical protein